MAKHFLGGGREDVTIAGGTVSANPVATREAGSTTAQNGTKSDGGFQMLADNGSKKERMSKEEWKWQRGIVIVTHPVRESHGTGPFSV